MLLRPVSPRVPFLLLSMGAAALTAEAGGASLLDYQPNVIISALAKVVDYYELNFSQMNLDAIFGLRALQGCLLEILAQLRGHPVPKSTLEALQRLEAKADQISQLADPVMQSNEPEYYHAMSFVLWHPFRPQYRRRKTNESLLWPKWTFKERAKITQKNLGEGMTDNCIMEICGMLGDEPCRISRLCERGMLKRGAVGYGLTHQVLYTAMAEQWQCGDVLSAALDSHEIARDVSSWQAELCTNMLRDVRKMMANDSSDDAIYDRDLFFEQIFVCGTLGFEEFMPHTWLPLILQEQDRSGCYKEKALTEAPFLRKLLSEKILSDGCLAHTTAVAAGALAAYLERIIFSLSQSALWPTAQRSDCCFAMWFAPAATIITATLLFRHLRRRARLVMHCSPLTT